LLAGEAVVEPLRGTAPAALHPTTESVVEVAGGAPAGRGQAVGAIEGESLRGLAGGRLRGLVAAGIEPERVEGGATGRLQRRETVGRGIVVVTELATALVGDAEIVERIEGERRVAARCR